MEQIEKVGDISESSSPSEVAEQNLINTISAEIIEVTYAKLKELISGKKLSPTSIAIVVLNFMIIIQQTKGLSGKQRKELVLYLLNRYVSEHLVNDEESAQLLFTIKFVVPSMIDKYCDLDRKTETIQGKERKTFTFTCCK